MANTIKNVECSLDSGERRDLDQAGSQRPTHSQSDALGIVNPDTVVTRFWIHERRDSRERPAPTREGHHETSLPALQDSLWAQARA